MPLVAWQLELTCLPLYDALSTCIHDAQCTCTHGWFCNVVCKRVQASAELVATHDNRRVLVWPAAGPGAAPLALHHTKAFQVSTE